MDPSHEASEGSDSCDFFFLFQHKFFAKVLSLVTLFMLIHVPWGPGQPRTRFAVGSAKKAECTLRQAHCCLAAFRARESVWHVALALVDPPCGTGPAPIKL